MQPRHVQLPPQSQSQAISPTHSRWRADGRPPNDQYATASPMKMQVPDRRSPIAPPPLPPPRYVSDAESGDDGDRFWEHAPCARRSVQGPRGGGSSFPKGWTQRTEMKPLDRAEHRRQSATAPSSWATSPTDLERRYERDMRLQDEGYYSLPGASPGLQHLPGERQLHHRDQKNSSQAYDKNLLSRIGKPTASPSRASHFGSVGSVESSPTSSLFSAARHPDQMRSLSFPNGSQGSLADPPIKQEPGRFADSPRSRPLSPRSIPPTSFPEFRNPVFDQSSRSSTVDTDGVPPPAQRFPNSINISRQQKSRRSGSSGSTLTKVDESAPFITAKSENYDQSIFSEQDSTIPMAEHVRHLHLEDRFPLTSHPDSTTLPSLDSLKSVDSSMSLGGAPKRKRSHEDPQSDAAAAAALTMQAARAQEYINSPPQHPHPQSATHFTPQQTSISSQSSGPYRHDSYPSVSQSSYTSYDQQSPGGVSPTSEAQHNPYYPTQDTQYMMTAKDARTGPYPSQAPTDNRFDPSKTLLDSRKQDQHKAHAPFTCNCCTKKPKKFATAEELSQHQNEKQYSCGFCSNKFKNKNEAERHQNSIHRRTNSWSCAELEKFEDAYFPAGSFNAMTTSTGTQTHMQNGQSPTDICGYCGEEFSNEPPDFEARQQHLVTMHKWGECNKAKKFWRADHFRQHLKHSHGGKNGKHTNAIEQRCAKDEPPQISDDSQSSTPTPVAGAPVANMGNLRPSPTMGHPHDMTHPHMQMSPQPGNMGPPSGVGMDMSNIDPSFNYMTQQQPSLQQLQAAPAMGYEYKTDGV